MVGKLIPEGTFFDHFGDGELHILVATGQNLHIVVVDDARLDCHGCIVLGIDCRDFDFLGA